MAIEMQMQSRIDGDRVPRPADDTTSRSIANFHSDSNHPLGTLPFILPVPSEDPGIDEMLFHLL